MGTSGQKGAVFQLLKLRNGETIHGQIITMSDGEFVIYEPEKPLGHHRRRIPIYDVEYVFDEVLN
jgi:hypothetical protein